MNKLNKRKQNNGGFLSALAGLFKGGAAAGGGVAGTAATGGIFATKAGILGLLLGGATIAAGAGAVYHFVGSATNTAYAPDLFQKSYLEEEAALAGAERSQSQDRHASVNSSIGMFSAQAKKEGLGFEAREEEQQPEENSSASAQYSDEGSKASAAPAAYSASSAAAPRSSSNRLTSKGLSSSFGSGGGSSSGASAPRMKSMGGLSGGINSKFASMKSASLAEGNGNAQAMASAKKASISRGRNASARGARRSARSQAMFANAMGSKAAYSSSAAGARTSAESAFTGETTGSGDVAEGVLEGAGLGGAGLSMANELKSNDPNSNNSIKNVPPVNNASNDTPWAKTEKIIFGMLAAAAVLLVAGNILAEKSANTPDPKAKMGWYLATAIVAGAIAALGALIIGWSIYLYKEYKQSSALMYGIAGAFMAAQGGILLAKAIKGRSQAKQEFKNLEDLGKNCPEYKSQREEIDNNIEKLKNATKDADGNYVDKDGNILKNSKGENITKNNYKDTLNSYKSQKNELINNYKDYNSADIAKMQDNYNASFAKQYSNDGNGNYSYSVDDGKTSTPITKEQYESAAAYRDTQIKEMANAPKKYADVTEFRNPYGFAPQAASPATVNASDTAAKPGFFKSVGNTLMTSGTTETISALTTGAQNIASYQDTPDETTTESDEESNNED